MKMHFIFSLIKDHGMGPIQNIRCDFLSSMGRKAVHHKGILLGDRHQGLVHLKILKIRQTLGPFILLAHTGPNIRIYNIRALGRLFGIFYNPDVFRLLSQDLRKGMVSGGTGQEQFKPQNMGSIDPGLGHIIAVAYPGHPEIPQCTPLFLYRHEVAEDLAGVVFVCKGVNHRDVRPLGHLLHLLLGIGPDGQDIQIPGKHPCSVFYGLIP